MFKHILHARKKVLTQLMVAACMIVAWFFITPMPAFADTIDPGTAFDCVDAPCIDEIWWDKTNAIEMHINYSGSFDSVNVIINADSPSGLTRELDELHPDSQGQLAIADLSYRTYNVSVEACTSHFLRHSTCTPWSAPAAISTVPTNKIKVIGPMHLKFADSNKCLDDPNNSVSNGVLLDQWDCVNQANESWYLDYYDTTNFKIRSASNDKCVNISYAKYEENARIILWSCENYLNEFFRSTRVPGIANTYWFSPTANVTLSLNVRGGYKTNGARLILWNKGLYPNEYIQAY